MAGKMAQPASYLDCGLVLILVRAYLHVMVKRLKRIDDRLKLGCIDKGRRLS